jgi:hypothetical protein
LKYKVIGEITEIRLIAAGRAIRELKRLRKAYGAGRWRKLKGFASIQFSNGTIQQAELHWYEAHGVGRKETKIKRIIA